MCNATIKPIRFITATLTLTALTFLASCKGDNSAAEAQSLYDRAEAAINAGDNAGAMALLDSLDSRYASQTEIRRRAMHLRSLAREGLCTVRLAEADSMLVVTQLRADSLRHMLTWVNNDVEGYFIVEGTSLPPTGIQARVSSEGVFYLISSLEGHNIGHTSLSLSSDNGSVTSTSVAYDGERNRRDSGAELVHFVGAECDTLGHFAFYNRRGPVTLTFNGQSGATYSRPLTMGELSGIATAWDYASSLVRLKVYNLEHEKLERQLAVARSQSARTLPDPDSTATK